MKKTLLILLFLLILSCDKEDDLSISQNEIKIDSYFLEYMLNPKHSGTNQLVNLRYDKQGRVIKKTGGFIKIASNSGFVDFFTDEVYDSISYTDNSIVIERKSIKLNQTEKLNRFIFLNNKGQISYKVIETSFYNSKDTLNYEYNSVGKITNVIYKNGSKESFFYYNLKQNLDSVVTNEYYQNKLYKKTLELFEEYDNQQNPVKNLYIFEETFYRSLSENNFSRYEKKVFDSSNELINETIKNWTFTYDENGIVQFDL